MNVYQEEIMKVIQSIGKIKVAVNMNIMKVKKMSQTTSIKQTNKLTSHAWTWSQSEALIRAPRSPLHTR